jgi:hypothetical protein
MSNVRPTEARKARRTTLDKTKIPNICIPLRKLLALKKQQPTFFFYLINLLLPLIPWKNPIG